MTEFFCRGKHKPYFLLLTFLLPFSISAQIGGQASFDFINLPATARLAALGGENVSSYGSDAAMFVANPALLTDSTHRKLSLYNHWYYADVNHFSAAYTHKFKGEGMWGFSLQTVSYGEMEELDATGEPLGGTFRARDFAMIVGYSRQAQVFRLGVNAKLVQSSFGQYSASALLFDLGGAFIHPEKDLVVGLNIKNVGFALQKFANSDSFVTPIDIQTGITYKPEKMPLRFSITYHHLHQFDIAFDDPELNNQVDAFGNPIFEEVSFADKLSQHFVLGGEFVLSQNVNIRAGYNFLRRQELQLENVGGAAGFSFGFMLRIKKLELAFSRSIYHVTGGTNSLTLAIDTRSVTKKKRTIE